MANGTVPTARPNRRRRILLRLCFTALITLVAAEVVMRIGFFLFVPAENVASLIQREMELTQHSMSGRRSTQPNVLHPYVGFVVDPTRDRRFNEWGFWQVDGPILKRAEKQIIVGITGGSVARDLCDSGVQRLREEVNRRFPDHSVKIVCLAHEGFREPQLAMTVSYFQMLGAEFDVIVSLSGFNEATLHPAECPTDEMWIGYPRGWNIRLTDTEDPQISELIWRGQMLQIRRQNVATRFYALRGIPLLAIHGTWAALDRVSFQQLFDTAKDLAIEREKMERRYANTGPFQKFESDEQRRYAQCEMWLAGTRHLQRLCDASNASFLLCMQPNLYDTGMKRLTEEEQKLGAGVYSSYVRQNYPHFAQAAEELEKEGIAFRDLRALFKDTEETIYRDACCHFNQIGTDKLATEMAKIIADVHLRKRSR